MASYYPGEVAHLTLTFSNAETGVLTDPGAASILIQPPDGGTVLTETPTRDGVGLYHYDFTVVLPAGSWQYKGVGTGAVEAIGLKAFDVIDPGF